MTTYAEWYGTEEPPWHDPHGPGEPDYPADEIDWAFTPQPIHAPEELIEW